MPFQSEQSEDKTMQKSTPVARKTQIQVKVTEQEKARFNNTARMYNLTAASFARYAMEYIANHKPTLLINPTEIEDTGQKNGKSHPE
jgi:hypothetical protein